MRRYIKGDRSLKSERTKKLERGYIDGTDKIRGVITIYMNLRQKISNETRVLVRDD